MEHVFCGCPFVKKFWEQLGEKFSGKVDMDSVFNAKFIILGVLDIYSVYEKNIFMKLNFCQKT